MAEKRPLCLYSGVPEELRTNDTLPGGGGGGSGPDYTDPTVAPWIWDDFLSSSPEAGEAGSLNWGYLNGSLAAIGAAVAAHPGVMRRTSSTTANQVAHMQVGQSPDTKLFRFDEFNELTWVFAPVTAGTDFSLRLGLSADWGSVAPAHALFIEKAAADTSFFGTSRNNSTESRTAALKAVVANAWTKVKMRRISASSVGFSIDSGAEVTLGSNIMDAADTMQPGLQIVPTTTTVRSVDIDFFSMKLLAQAR